MSITNIIYGCSLESYYLNILNLFIFKIGVLLALSLIMESTPWTDSKIVKKSGSVHQKKIFFSHARKKNLVEIEMRMRWFRLHRKQFSSELVLFWQRGCRDRCVNFVAGIIYLQNVKIKLVLFSLVSLFVLVSDFYFKFKCDLIFTKLLRDYCRIINSMDVNSMELNCPRSWFTSTEMIYWQY